MLDYTRLKSVAREDFDVTAAELRVLLALHALRSAHGEEFCGRERAILSIILKVEGEAPAVATCLNSLINTGLVQRIGGYGEPKAYRITRRGIQRLVDGGGVSRVLVLPVYGEDLVEQCEAVRS